MYVEMTENLQLGVSILGLGALQKMENVYVSTTVLKSGFSYQPSKKLQLLGEIEKSLMQAIVYKAGVEYKPVESFSLRLGSSLNRRSISFGVGYQLKSVLTVDIGSTWQQVLGWSPHVGILYSFTKDNAN